MVVQTTTTRVPAIATIELAKKSPQAPPIMTTLNKKPLKSSTQVSWYVSHEVPRKVWHSSIGFFVLGYHFWYGATLGQCLVWLAPLALSFIALDISRLSREWLNTWFCRVFGSMLRPHEQKSLTSSSFFYGGVLLALLLSPNNSSAVLSILYLSWSDTVAGVFGKYYSRLVLNGMTWWELKLKAMQQIRFGNRRGRRQAASALASTKPPAGAKSVAGSLACFAFSAVLTFVYLLVLSKKQPLSTLLNASLRGGLIASFSELVGGSDLFGNVDDDLVIPLMSTFLLRIFTSIPDVLSQ